MLGGRPHDPGGRSQGAGAPGVPDLAARSGRIHRKVPDAAGRPPCPRDGLAAHHDAAPDPGAEGDQGEGILAAPRPEPGLGVGEGAHVVGHGAGQPGGLGDPGGQGDIAPAQEAGHDHGPPPDDGRPQGNPDRVRPATTALGQAGHDGGDQGGHGVGVGLGQRQGFPDQDLAQWIGQDGVEAVGGELDARDGGGARNDGQEAGGPPRPAGLHRGPLLDEAGLDERTHRARRRGRRQSQAPAELAAAHGTH